MTTYGEAVQMGLGANLAVSIGNEVLCAGDALAKMILDENMDIRPEIPTEFKPTLTHVMRHLAVVRELAETLDEHYDREISAFDDANPGKLQAVSVEISELPIIRVLQDIIGMTDEQRMARAQHNLEALQKMNEGKLN